MGTFGFAPGFVAMTRTLYCETESVLRVNGGLSAPFTIERGIRQGCAMSGMLYFVAIEPMLCQVGKQLTGVKLRDNFSPLHLGYKCNVMYLLLFQRHYYQRVLKKSPPQR